MYVKIAIIIFKKSFPTSTSRKISYSLVLKYLANYTRKYGAPDYTKVIQRFLAQVCIKYLYCYD